MYTVATILSSVYMDYDNNSLAWLDPFLHRALQEVIYLCMKECVAMLMWNYVLYHLPIFKSYI